MQYGGGKCDCSHTTIKARALSFTGYLSDEEMGLESFQETCNTVLDVVIELRTVGTIENGNNGHVLLRKLKKPKTCHKPMVSAIKNQLKPSVRVCWREVVDKL